MSQSGSRLEPAAEIGWLILSTSLCTLAAVQESGTWRAAWLAVLVVNAVVVGYRIKRMRSPRAAPGQPPT